MHKTNENYHLTVVVTFTNFIKETKIETSRKIILHHLINSFKFKLDIQKNYSSANI